MAYADSEAGRQKKRESNRRYREKNPEKDLERLRRYRKKNPDKKREQDRRYRKKHPDRQRERQKVYRAKNLEWMRAKEARLRAESRDRIRESDRRYREKNPEKKRLYHEKNRERFREKIRDQNCRYHRRLRDISLSSGIKVRAAAALLAIEKLKKEIDRMSPRQDSPPSKLAGANRINPGKGLHPGGKPSPSARVREAQQLVVSEEFGIAEDVVGESAPSARILARGVSNHGDMQAFLEALALDVVHGRVDHKTANFLLQTIRTRVGLWVQAQTFGAKLDIAPYREVDAKQIPSEATDSQ